MIKLTYEQFRILNGARGLTQKLVNTPLPPQLGYAVKKVYDKLQAQGKVINDEFIKLQDELKEKFAVRNEDGSIKTPEGQPEGGFEVAPDKQEGYQAELKAFDARTFQVDRPALPEQAFLNGNMQLSVGEWTAMEPLFVEADPKLIEEGNVKSIHQAALNDHLKSV